ncbi:MAG: hypothetical protein WC777_02575 [Candidatus Gracilibacteria bacterium]|jgi:hypothetical protein
MDNALEVAFQIFISIILPAVVAFLTATYLKEHEVKFTKLHELRLEKISLLYSKISRGHKAIYGVIQAHKLDKENYNEISTKLDSAIEALFDLDDFFDENAIFFSEKIVQNMSTLSTTLTDIAADFIVYTDQKEATENESYAKEALKALKTAAKTFNNVTPKVVKILEEEFRALMGVAA